MKPVTVSLLMSHSKLWRISEIPRKRIYMIYKKTGIKPETVSTNNSQALTLQLIVNNSNVMFSMELSLKLSKISKIPRNSFNGSKIRFKINPINSLIYSIVVVKSTRTSSMDLSVIRSLLVCSNSLELQLTTSNPSLSPRRLNSTNISLHSWLPIAQIM